VKKNLNKKKIKYYNKSNKKSKMNYKKINQKNKTANTNNK